jgi:hypothetical protein
MVDALGGRLQRETGRSVGSALPARWAPRYDWDMNSHLAAARRVTA